MAVRAPTSNPSGVERVDWTGFLRRFRWKQGEHVCLIGPTGRGKSTLAGLILTRRDYVLALDLKGNDSTLRAWGWEKVYDWPPPDLERRLEQRREQTPDGREVVKPPPPYRVILDPPKEDLDQIETEVYREAIRDAYRMRGWTIYVDELLLATDRDHDLGPYIHKCLVSGRDRRVSIVTSTQTPNARDANVPKSVYQQATHLFIWPVRDTRGLERVEDITGVGRLLRDTLAHLPKHDVLYVKPPDTLLVTRAPKLEPPPARAAATVQLDDRHDRPPARKSRLRELAWKGQPNEP